MRDDKEEIIRFVLVGSLGYFSREMQQLQTLQQRINRDPVLIDRQIITKETVFNSGSER